MRSGRRFTLFLHTCHKLHSLSSVSGRLRALSVAIHLCQHSPPLLPSLSLHQPSTTTSMLAQKREDRMPALPEDEGYANHREQQPATSGERRQRGESEKDGARTEHKHQTRPIHSETGCSTAWYLGPVPSTSIPTPAASIAAPYTRWTTCPV